MNFFKKSVNEKSATTNFEKSNEKFLKSLEHNLDLSFGKKEDPSGNPNAKPEVFREATREEIRQKEMSKLRVQPNTFDMRGKYKDGKGDAPLPNGYGFNHLRHQQRLINADIDGDAKAADADGQLGFGIKPGENLLPYLRTALVPTSCGVGCVCNPCDIQTGICPPCSRAGADLTTNPVLSTTHWACPVHSVSIMDVDFVPDSASPEYIEKGMSRQSTVMDAVTGLAGSSNAKRALYPRLKQQGLLNSPEKILERPTLKHFFSCVCVD